MSETRSGEFPVWRTPEGEPVSCVEKIKVLNENLAELRALGLLSGPVDLVLAIIGVAVIIAVIVFLRRNEARLQREADQAMPGPLKAPR